MLNVIFYFCINLFRCAIIFDSRVVCVQNINNIRSWPAFKHFGNLQNLRPQHFFVAETLVLTGHWCIGVRWMINVHFQQMEKSVKYLSLTVTTTNITRLDQEERILELAPVIFSLSSFISFIQGFIQHLFKETTQRCSWLQHGQKEQFILIKNCFCGSAR